MLFHVHNPSQNSLMHPAAMDNFLAELGDETVEINLFSDAVVPDIRPPHGHDPRRKRPLEEEEHSAKQDYQFRFLTCAVCFSFKSAKHNDTVVTHQLGLFCGLFRNLNQRGHPCIKGKPLQ